MRFSVSLVVFLFFITITITMAHSNAFKEKSCGKAIMSRFWALCPSGVNTNDPRQLYFATLLCGVGFSDQEIQAFMCPMELEILGAK